MTKISTNKKVKVDKKAGPSSAASVPTKRTGKAGVGAVAAAAGGGGRRRTRWEDRFDECDQYRKANGHCKVPTNFRDNRGLGIWVQEQRRNYKLLKQGKKPKAKLTDEQIERLDGIGFHWGYTPDPNSAESDSSWQSNFERLVKYRDSNGDFDVPLDGGNDSATAGGGSTTTELAKWTRAQRNQYNMRATKRKTFMTKERATKLTEIDFDWDGPRTF